MAGHLYISEYNNYGDVQWETPVEPGQRVSKIEIGEVFEAIAAATRFVVLFATKPCLVTFVPQGEDISQADERAFPLAPQVETLRLVHMNTRFRIATYPMDE